MIQITKITITDFGRHRTVEQKFDGHVIGLCGPNGLGKSTVLQALQFALTGTIDHTDPLRAFIRQSSCDKPPKAAEVVVEFIADGKAGRITRRITNTTSSRKLEWEGLDKPLTSEKAVTDLLFEILGVDKKAINSTVFIKQGEMASMFGKDTERRDFYTKLLMLGHLDRVADVVEVHRKHMADTVQDQGAARDAAEATYREAQEYFEACDSELINSPSVANSLTTARKLMKRFEDQAEAEELVRKATDSLREHISEGQDPVVWIETQTREMNSWRDKLEQLTKRRGAHLQARADSSEAIARHAKLVALKKQFDEMDAAALKLKDLPGLNAESPEAKIRVLEGLLNDFKKLADAVEQLPKLTEENEKLRIVFDAAQAKVAEAQDSYDKLRGDYQVEAAGLKMREEILKGIEESHVDIEGKPCPLCGSGEPEKSYLVRTIDESKAILSTLRLDGENAGRALRMAKNALEAATRDLSRAKELLTVTDTTRKRLTVELAMRNEDTVRRDLAQAKKDHEVFITKYAERTRLSQLIEKIQREIGRDNPRPTDNAISAAEAELHEANKAYQAATWSESDEVDLTNSGRHARSSREILDAAQRQVANMDAANERLDKAEAELQAGISSSDEWLKANGFSGVLLSQEILEKITDLEHRQKCHDEARGRKEAANTSLRAASRRIEEIDLRIAEQKHRLKLVADLTKLRDTFKPNGASLDYLNYKFGKIARLAGDYLAESGADFMVAPSEEIPLAFEHLCTNEAEGKWMSQNRMSGGQKVRLAVATLRAIHAMIMPEVGLLVLDEPTTHLDDEAKRSMADMLHKIGEEGTLQMVVCDHSPILIDAFSDTIQLQAS